MGPHFFKCGKASPLAKPDKSRVGFNGAALFQVRKGFLISPIDWGIARFNGAALFQVRKGDDELTVRGFYIKLQWGRTFSSAERKLDSVSSVLASKLQWGRTFSSAESQMQFAVLLPLIKSLQWGRTFSSAES